MEKLKICTVNTDASFVHQKKEGGWAFWLVSDYYKVRDYGKFKEPVHDVQTAEMMAVINALHIVKKRGVVFDRIVVNCDNSTVRACINRMEPHNKFPVSLVLINILRSFGCKVYAKEIRGHSKESTPRQIVNNWCDKMSRAYKYEK